MKTCLITLLLAISIHCFGQKFNFEFGIGPTVSLIKFNTVYSTAPSYYPTITVENSKSEGGRSFEEIDWIKSKNYLGIEPSIGIIYNISPKLALGFNLIARERQIIYDVCLPVFEGLALYSHKYEFRDYFVLSSFLFRYKSTHNFIFDLDAGFNYPLNRSNKFLDYNTTINQFEIDERTYGHIKGHQGLDFTLNPVIRFTGHKRISERLLIGLAVEKQLKNDYGSDITIINLQTQERILSASIRGSELTFGVRITYSLLSKNSEK